MSLIDPNNKFKIIKEHSGGFFNPNPIFILQGGGFMDAGPERGFELIRYAVTSHKITLLLEG